MQDNFDSTVFESKVKASLDESTASIDADTRKRLAYMRSQALNTQTRHGKPARWLALSNWWPSTWLAFGVLLALFFVLQNLQQSQQKTPTNAGEDQVAVFEMLNNADDLDLQNNLNLADPDLADLDFYLWADEQLATEADYAA